MLTSLLFFPTCRGFLSIPDQSFSRFELEGGGRETLPRPPPRAEMHALPFHVPWYVLLRLICSCLPGAVKSWTSVIPGQSAAFPTRTHARYKDVPAASLKVHTLLESKRALWFSSSVISIIIKYFWIILIISSCCSTFPDLIKSKAYRSIIIDPGTQFQVWERPSQHFKIISYFYLFPARIDIGLITNWWAESHVAEMWSRKDRIYPK